MSEIEPVSDRQEPPPPPTTNGDTSATQDDQKPQTEQNRLSSPPNANGPASTRSSAPSTPGATHSAPTQVKRFSSANINQKFLQKVSSAHSSTPSSPAQPTTSPAQTTSTSTPAAGSPHAASPGAKWQKDTSGQTIKPSVTGADASAAKLGLPSSKGAPITKNRAQNGQPGPAWTSLTGTAKTNPRTQNEFPTAAELKDKAEKAAANSAAQRRSLDAFRGVHLDPNAQHWDEMTEEEDFLSGAIEFGDGKQYTVAPTTETQPETKESNGLDGNVPREPSVKPPEATTVHPDRSMHDLPPTRPSPTLLHATPFGRGGPVRRGSDTRPFRDGPAWGSQRNSYIEPSERDRDSRGRRPSASERDRLPISPGALGPHLRDRSPDGSGRFPGRTIVPNRRDSQASSAVAGPPRSARAHSKESTDRGNSARQLPPHLEQVKDVPSHVSSTSSRDHWRESSTNARSGLNAIHDSQPPLAPVTGDKDVASALIEDEEALKTSMAVAAERARKRRQEEEEERERQRERAKQKLLELEARIQAEKEEKERKVKEEEERLKREKEEKEKREREEVERDKERTREQLAKERVSQTKPSRPLPPSERADSWRSSAPRFLSTTEPSQKSVKDVNEPRRPPTILQKTRPLEQPTTSGAKERPGLDLSGKPASSATIPELAALQSPDSDGPVEVLDFADLRQLAEGYHGSLSVNTLPINGVESSPSSPLVNLRSTTESHGGRSQHTRRDSLTRSHIGAQADDIHSRSLKSARAQPPAPLVLGPRGSHDTGHPNSAALSSARSPRTFDSNHPYKEAPISVLDDTMSRFKTALMHSNPVHAGMSSDAIMLGLERAEAEELIRVKNAKVLAEHAAITGQATWCQTQEQEPEEEDEGLNVLIPTLSLNREPVPARQLALIKYTPPWRWDCLSFEPPVPYMNKRTLSVFDVLTEGTKNQTSIRIQIPGMAPKEVAYHARPTRAVPTERPRRLERPEIRPTNPPAVVNSTPAVPKSAPLNSQWPPKSNKGSDEAVWRRAIPVTSAENEQPSAAEPTNPPTPKSAPLQKHNRAFSSPLGTPSMSSTWGRSPLSLPVTEEAWKAATTKNSLMDIADEPPPHIPTSISELRSEDGDRSKAPERRATPPQRAKYDPHRAFQQVTPQSTLPPQTASPAAPPVSIPSPYPTPRTNALALTTNKTPGHTPPGSVPPPAGPTMMPSRPPFPATYSSPLLPNATPFNQSMVATPQYAPPASMAPPLTPGMIHRGVNQPMQMPSTPSMTPMWAPQTPGSTGPIHGGYMRPQMPPVSAYQNNMMPQQQQQPSQPPLQLYMPQSGMLPPSPGVSPLMPPGMSKPFPPGPRTSIGSNGPMPMSMGYPSPQSQGPYMMSSPMLPPLPQQAQQQPLPHARIPQMPQGRGMPMQASPYQQIPPGAPGAYPHPW
ncbi:hypothetical protein PIIN_02678 [Serendipita indica DSM 11827]|uniref:Uncharacterized protein n=1 Tax=Serendipita indica (strain DSM 11827) TaxID=1109443 RepID=G4TBX4_SERID|nr:hypothetical protein PIIN_02678 [Serendipita indica DSM 11827]